MERLDNSRLSPVQKNIVDAVSREKYLAVIGGPGTGKTVLAISGMAKNRDGNKQILLTYSKPLSKMICGCKVRSSTVHSFCWQLGSEIEKLRGAFSGEYDTDDQSNYRFNNVINREYGYSKTGWPQWDRIYEDILKLSPSNQERFKHYEIFIDEGQDLPDEAFMFFRKIADKIVVTYDEAQEVGNENGESDQLIKKAGVECNRILGILDLQESFYDLIDNYRNTVSIEKVAKLFFRNYGESNAVALNLDSAIGKKIGEKPRVCFGFPTQHVIDKIADDAYQLNKQIGIIIPDHDSFSNIKIMFDSAVSRKIIPGEKFFFKCGKNADNMNNSSNLNQTGVFLTTFKSSKGMEFDDVYIFGCNKAKLSNDSERNQFYVAATRAKDKLTFYFECRSDAKCPVLDVINENRDLFDIAG